MKYTMTDLANCATTSQLKGNPAKATTVDTF